MSNKIKTKLQQDVRDLICSAKEILERYNKVDEVDSRCCGMFDTITVTIELDRHLAQRYRHNPGAYGAPVMAEVYARVVGKLNEEDADAHISI